MKQRRRKGNDKGDAGATSGHGLGAGKCQGCVVAASVAMVTSSVWFVRVSNNFYTKFIIHFYGSQPSWINIRVNALRSKFLNCALIVILKKCIG